MGYVEDIINKSTEAVKKAWNYRQEMRYNRKLAIKLKCRDCCCDSYKEVQYCEALQCPLYPFRDGSNPFTKRKGNPHWRKDGESQEDGNGEDGENGEE